MLTRPLHPKDLATFADRAKYVHHLTYNDAFVDAECLRLIHECIPIPQLFSSLSTLVWDCAFIGQIQGVELFAHPGLLDLRIRVEYTKAPLKDDVVGPVFMSVARGAPHLKGVAIHMPYVELEEAIVQLISGTPDARYLSLKLGAKLTNQATTQISTLPQLRRLGLNCNHPSTSPMSLNEGFGFRSLIELKLRLPTVAQCREIVERVLGPLRSLDIQCTTYIYDQPEILHGYLLAVSRHTSLTELWLTFPKLPAIADPIPDPELYHTTFHTLQPLCHLSNLELFHLGFRFTPDLDDAEVAQLANSWPRLRYFVLPTRQMRPGRVYWSNARAGRKAVMAILDACPYLNVICMNINRSIPWPEGSQSYHNRLASLGRCALGPNRYITIDE